MLESAKLEVLDITYSNFETKAYFAGNLETNGEHSEDLELDTKIWAQIMGLKKSAEDLQALNKRTVVEKLFISSATAQRRLVLWECERSDLPPKGE